MTLSDLGDYLSEIEESIVAIRDSEIESQLEDLEQNISIAAEALENGSLYDKLTEMQNTVKALLAGFEAMNSVNLEEVAK